MASILVKQFALILAMGAGELVAKAMAKYLSQKIKTWTIL